MKLKAKLNLLLTSLASLAIMLGIIFALPASKAKIIHADDNLLYSENFDGDTIPAGWEFATLKNGMAWFNTGFNTIPVPQSAFVESNNYELSFDIIADTTTSDDLFYLHLIGLNGDTHENIYVKANNNGTYWCMTDFGYHPIYNNSGDEHGGLDGSAVDLTLKHNVKVVHFNGYLELWIDGTRRAVSHLSNFGNNNYDTRIAITEGKITGFAIDARGAISLDNVKLVEAMGKDLAYSEHTDVTATNNVKILPLSAQNLYSDNFKIEAKFSYSDITATNYYPAITLFGLNNSTGLTTNKNHYGVAFQSYADREFLTAQVFARKDADWASLSAQGDPAYVSATKDGGVQYKIEVFGDQIRYYINGELKISSSFTEWGITKGYLQYIRISAGNGGMYWTDISYQGYDKATAVDVTTSSTRIKITDTAVFKAEKFGAETTEDFSWYVDGVKQTETTTTLSLSGLTKGVHKVKYASASFTSNEIALTVLENVITIAADKTEAYTTETMTITATLDGDFESEAPVWYVNDTAQAETSATLALTGLATGEYKVVYKNTSTESNELSLTVKEGKIEIITEKNNYLTTETATLTAEMVGIPESDEISWYINEVKLDETGDTLQIALSSYHKGDTIFVQVKTESGLEAEAYLNIYFDAKAEVTGDENYQTFEEVEVENGSTYGNYQGQDGVLVSTEVGGSWYTLTGDKPTTMQFALNYEFFVPETISSSTYLYPGFMGYNTKYPNGFVEIAMEVAPDGLRPYIKDQADSNKIYNISDYGFGLDLSYAGTVAKKGDWNSVNIVVSGKYLSVYLNNVQIYFVNYVNGTLPSSISFNTYLDGGVPGVKIRNISLCGVVEPAPELESVVCSVSKTSLKISETCTVQANINPFNAEYTTIQWYVNDVLVEESELSYTFASTTAGEYKIYCKIDGIKSNVKTITVQAEEKKSSGCRSNLDGASVCLIVLFSAAVVAFAKRKQNG